MYITAEVKGTSNKHMIKWQEVFFFYNSKLAFYINAGKGPFPCRTASLLFRANPHVLIELKNRVS